LSFWTSFSPPVHTEKNVFLERGPDFRFYSTFGQYRLGGGGFAGQRKPRLSFPNSGSLNRNYHSSRETSLLLNLPFFGLRGDSSVSSPRPFSRLAAFYVMIGLFFYGTLSCTKTLYGFFLTTLGRCHLSPTSRIVSQTFRFSPLEIGTPVGKRTTLGFCLCGREPFLDVFALQLRLFVAGRCTPTLCTPDLPSRHWF